MRISRLYVDTPLDEGLQIQLPPGVAHYVGNVLRLKADATVVLFNGDGFEYRAGIIAASKKQVSVCIQSRKAGTPESPLQTHLGLG
ncbi:MAG: RNA methyltransferase PUA domain-containing protein, partial [Pseudohongiellaceae bacterium]